MDSFANVGHFPTWEKELISLLEPPDCQYKEWLQTATAPHCQTRPLESCHFFLSPPKDARKCDLHGDVGWICGLTEVLIYPAWQIQIQMIAVLATLIQGLRDTG